MKVGILTLFYETFNYGAQLQSCALVRAVKKQGHECEQISFKWANINTQYSYLKNLNLNRNEFWDFCDRYIPHSSRVYTPVNIKECVEQYDVFISGSDQIFGVNNSMPEYVLPIMACSFVPENKQKFTYAASFGGITQTPERTAILDKVLKSLDAVSVREKSALPFAEKLYGKHVETVVDPVLLLDAAEWEMMALPTERKNYILVYTLAKNPEIYTAARNLAEQHGYEIIEIMGAGEKACGPAKFLGLFHNANIVLTDSFHGTVFSALFHKEFLSFPIDRNASEYARNVRMLDFLESVGLKERYINSDEQDIMALCTQSIEFENVDLKLSELREKSLLFLEENLRYKKEISVNEVKTMEQNLEESKKPEHEYFRIMKLNWSSEQLYWETKYWELYCEKENVNRVLHQEQWRSALLAKASKYQCSGALLEKNLCIGEWFMIYGAGKLGKILEKCSQNGFIGFIDKNVQGNIVANRPVYKLNHELKNILSKQKKVTIIITPVWDFYEIKMELESLYENIKVVSAIDILESI